MRRLLIKKRYWMLLIMPFLLFALVAGGYLPTKPAEAARTSAIIADHTSINIDKIPVSYIEQAKSLYRLAYGHTSHGSQIITGMRNLYESAGPLYYFNTDGSNGALKLVEMPGDLGHNGSLAWEATTRERLSWDSSISMVMWSWCGGVSDNTVEGINVYLNAMNRLENDFPHVTFVYMTGHLDGSGENGNLHRMNNIIRDYVRNNNKVLFDFADIESYDPDGNYYLDRGADDGCYYDGGNWAIQWCERNAGNALCQACSCAHSQSLNCNTKGRAFWWMLARLSGWTGESSLYEGDEEYNAVVDRERSLVTAVDYNLASRLSGRILLQVQEHGEAWYVYPNDRRKYYLGRPLDAWNVMRFLGLGITNADLAKIPTYNNYQWDAERGLIERVRGKILLQVEEHGEAWYVSPVNDRRYYLGRPADAFQLMRNLGLGINNEDIRKIGVGSL